MSLVFVVDPKLIDKTGWVGTLLKMLTKVAFVHITGVVKDDFCDNQLLKTGVEFGIVIVQAYISIRALILLWVMGPRFWVLKVIKLTKGFAPKALNRVLLKICFFCVIQFLFG